MRWPRTPFIGRCCKPVSGRRDPKRSPTGASIGIPQSGRRRLKNPASQHRSGRASSLRMSEFFSRRGGPAPFRCSPQWGCASDGSWVLGWQSPNALASDPFMGRCCKPVSGRRDPKRSPTGASIGIPQSGRRRLKNPASQHRSGRASSLRMSEFFSRRGCPAPFRCSPHKTEVRSGFSSSRRLGSGLSLPGSVQATRRSKASRYLAAVFSSTSCGKRGAGGVLSQVWVSSQSRTNCLSNDGGLMPTR
ncbi:hypothetical protein LMG26852_04605 [Achromobacter aegrifaciens]|nr:hypothetical protein LMG26852_04605 [Achromobacter aegrifaciens]